MYIYVFFFNFDVPLCQFLVTYATVCVFIRRLSPCTLYRCFCRLARAWCAVCVPTACPCVSSVAACPRGSFTHNMTLKYNIPLMQCDRWYYITKHTEANSRSADQDILSLTLNLWVHYRVHKSPPLVHILTLSRQPSLAGSRYFSFFCLLSRFRSLKPGPFLSVDPAT
jgi:hypothetical protein